ncbi:MAG: hypothetical protein M1450_02750 [Patescibacteria group bacterium]|nr:hypothetical protein [Patescibacteria group bacterium]
MEENKILLFIKTKKTIIIIFLFFIILVLSYFFLTKNKINKPGNQALPTPTLVILPTISEQTEKPNQKFKIISTIPKDGQKDVYAGETIISFTTDIPIKSAGEFKIEISPSLPYYWKIDDVYPTTKITARIFGGLKQNTVYGVKVINRDGDIVLSWSFKTSTQTPESSSGYVREKEKEFIQKYYPLFNFTPYNTSSFIIAYSAKLTLKVTIINKSINISIIKAQVNDWIKSKGVDPATHTINYVYGP